MPINPQLIKQALLILATALVFAFTEPAKAAPTQCVSDPLQSCRDYFGGGTSHQCYSCGTNITGLIDGDFTACYVPQYTTGVSLADCATSTETLSCESDVVKQSFEPWQIYLANEPQITIYQNDLSQSEVITTNYEAIQCLNTNIRSDPADNLSYFVYCNVQTSVTQTLNPDNNTREVRQISNISGIDASAPECSSGNQTVVTQNDTTNILAPSSTETETSVEDTGTQEVTTSQYEGKTYDPTTNTTSNCQTVVTATNITGSGTFGDSSNNGVTTSLSCVTEQGDTTIAGEGSGTITVVNPDGTVTTNTNNGGVTATPQADIVASIEGIEGLQEELEGLCDDPNGCEDFEEILESYDSTAIDNEISDAGDLMSGSLNDFVDGFINDTGDVEANLTGSAPDSGADLWPQVVTSFQAGSCADYELSFAQGSGTISCSDTSVVRIILTATLWLLVLSRLRYIVTRPPAFQ